MTANEPPDDRRGRFVEQGNVRRRDEGGPTDEARAGEKSWWGRQHEVLYCGTPPEVYVGVRTEVYGTFRNCVVLAMGRALFPEP